MFIEILRKISKYLLCIKLRFQSNYKRLSQLRILIKYVYRLTKVFEIKIRISARKLVSIPKVSQLTIL